MKIIIIGMGMIGKTILKTLVGEGHTITLIDESREKIEQLIETYDVMGVVGNGACLDIQLEAGAKDADLVIALTNSDELNIMACLVAKKAGAGSTIARVRNPLYRNQIELMKDELGISMVVNPELETANEIFNLISLPEIANLEHFAKGKACLVEVDATEGCALVGESLITLSKKFKTKVLICSVQRGSELIIPSGGFVIEAGDRISLTADSRSLGDFLREANLVKSPFASVMIVGGGMIGYYLAEALSKRKYKVKVVESNPEQAEEMAKRLPKVNVVCGNGTNHSVLIEEGIQAVDAFVALTGGDEANIIVSMFASEMGVRKTITQIKSEELVEMLGKKQIDHNVSPKHIVANRVVSYVRALSNEKGSNVLTLYRLVGEQVEALEFLAKAENERFYDKPLKELKLKDNCLVACIIRGGNVIIPDGNSCIAQGDNVVVVTTHKSFDDLADVFI